MDDSTRIGSLTHLAARNLPSSWYARFALVAVPTAATGGAVYWYRGVLADSFISAKDGTLTTLGLGLIPVAVWLAVFLWALAARRPWLRRPNLWLSSIALVALSLGLMAFRQPDEGALAWFTLDGDVSLGGDVGEAITGSVTWQGALRLLGIFVAGVALAAPPRAVSAAKATAKATGRLSVNVYVFLAVAAKGIASMYRFDQGSRLRRRKATAAGKRADSSALSQARSGYTPTSIDQEASGVRPSQRDWIPEAAPLEGSPPAVPSTPGAPAVSNGDDWDGQFDAEEELADVQEETDSRLPITGKFNRFWQSSPEEGAEEHAELEGEEGEGEEVDAAATMAAPAREWRRPPIDLLQEVPEGEITEVEMQGTAEIIKKTLADYGVEVEIGQVKSGPTVTMYGLIPGWVRRYKQVKETDEEGRPKLDEAGRPVVTKLETKTRVKVDSILAREKDLSLALKTPSIRIETPVMGKAQVGIEVPNPNASLVTLRSVMQSPEFVELRKKAPLPIALGKSSGGKTMVIDMAEMPHLLIAGSTGSGKSVCINTIVSCLIMEKSPAEMRLLLIDPKRVELTPYNGIPHLLTPVVVETDQVVGLLKGMIKEMLDRYRRMEEVGARNIASYNERVPEKIPYLVVAIDELADLMMSAAFDVEQSLCRLAQLGRATGIHLIIATQRPSVDIVTGLIKANFPSRIGFGVASQVDSRTILDTAGADKLLGRGDMLYLPLDASRPERAQGVFISDREIGALVNFWKNTPRAPSPRINLRAAKHDQVDEDEEEGTGDDRRDEFLDKAIALAQTYSKLSTSLLQRRLRIGYPRAARLMDQLEEQHIVGPSDGSKSRDVIISRT